MKVKLPPVEVKYLEVNETVVKQRLLPRSELEMDVPEQDDPMTAGIVLTEHGNQKIEAEDASILVIGPTAEVPDTHHKIVRIDETPTRENVADLSLGEWVAHPEITRLQAEPNQPQDVLNSWAGAFSYKEEDVERSVKGLRSP